MLVFHMSKMYIASIFFFILNSFLAGIILFWAMRNDNIYFYISAIGLFITAICVFVTGYIKNAYNRQ